MVLRTPYLIDARTLRRRHRPLIGALGVLLAFGLLAGCATPPPERPPFQGVQQSLTAGMSTRADVLRRAGEPTLSRRDGGLLIYATFQEGNLFVPLGKRVRRLAIGRWHLLIVRLDARGVVESVDAPWQTALPNATRDALCIWSGECFLVDDASLVVFATPDEDAAAKSFAAAAERCTLYAYADEDATFSAALNGAPIGTSAARGYFQWRLPPGRHEVTVYAEEDKERAARLAIDCAAGALLYVELGAAEAELARVDPARGQDGVRRGRLILDDL